MSRWSHRGDGATGLLAVAHGSRRPGHAATVEQLVSAVRRRRPDLQVTTGFLELSRPGVGEALDRLAQAGHREVVAVPLLLGEAYHSSVDLPGQLRAATTGRPSLTVHQAPVLGPHPLLQSTLSRRLREAGVRRGEPGLGVVVAAAGSSDPAAVATIAGVAHSLERSGWGPAVPAYASAAAPTPAQAVAMLRERGLARVAIATYLLAPGRFSEELAQAGGDVVAAPLGPAPEIADLVVERFDVAAAARPGIRARSEIRVPLAG